MEGVKANKSARRKGQKKKLEKWNNGIVEYWKKRGKRNKGMLERWKDGTKKEMKNAK